MPSCVCSVTPSILFQMVKCLTAGTSALRVCKARHTFTVFCKLLLPNTNTVSYFTAWMTYQMHPSKRAGLAQLGKLFLSWHPIGNCCQSTWTFKKSKKRVLQKLPSLAFLLRSKGTHTQTHIQWQLSWVNTFIITLFLIRKIWIYAHVYTHFIYTSVVCVYTYTHTEISQKFQSRNFCPKI